MEKAGNEGGGKLEGSDWVLRSNLVLWTPKEGSEREEVKFSYSL